MRRLLQLVLPLSRPHGVFLMQSGNSAATSSGLSGVASAVAPRKSMRGCWRKGEWNSESVFV